MSKCEIEAIEIAIKGLEEMIKSKEVDVDKIYFTIGLLNLKRRKV